MTEEQERYFAYLQRAMRPQSDEELAAIQLAQHQSMRGMDQEEIAKLHGDGLRNLFASPNT